MKVRLLRYLILIYTSLSIVVVQSDNHGRYYALLDHDVGISNNVIGVMSARSIEVCGMMCVSHGQCLTFGFVGNNCTLSGKLVDSKKLFTKYTSIGQSIYSANCIPAWSGMCREFSVTGVAYAACNGVYSLATDLAVNDRPVFVIETGPHPRFFAFHSKWFITFDEKQATGFHWSTNEVTCHPMEAVWTSAQFTCLAWTP